MLLSQVLSHVHQHFKTDCLGISGLHWAFCAAESSSMLMGAQCGSGLLMKIFGSPKQSSRSLRAQARLTGSLGAQSSLSGSLRAQGRLTGFLRAQGSLSDP